jgi:hypothetical protein
MSFGKIALHLVQVGIIDLLKDEYANCGEDSFILLHSFEISDKLKGVRKGHVFSTIRTTLKSLSLYLYTASLQQSTIASDIAHDLL